MTTNNSNNFHPRQLAIMVVIAVLYFTSSPAHAEVNDTIQIDPDRLSEIIRDSLREQLGVGVLGALRRPDLRPLNLSGETSLDPPPVNERFAFCGRTPRGDSRHIFDLVMTVENKFADILTTSKAEVTFHTRTGDIVKSFMVNPMGAGEIREYKVDWPTECDLSTGTTCEFEISLDSDNTITETSEDNNTVKGICLS